MNRLVFLFFFLSGCSSVLYRQDPSTGIVIEGVRAVTKPADELRQQVPTKNAPGCETEARAFWFVTHLPAIQEVYQIDLYLSRKAPNPSEPKYIGRCVLNPFSPQNVAQGAE